MSCPRTDVRAAEDRSGEWATLTAKYNALFFDIERNNWGAPFLALFEKTCPALPKPRAKPRGIAEGWPPEPPTQFHSALSEGTRKRPIAEIRRSPSRLFSSPTRVTASTDTQSAMRDNGDGLSMGARYGKPIQVWDLRG